MGSSLFSNDHIRAILSIAPEPTQVAASMTAPSARTAAPSPERGDSLSAESQKFLAAWRSWRGAALLPRRSQVQLTSIARLMPQILVLEVHGPDRAVFRLVGSDVEELYGARLTGRSFIKLADAVEQQQRGEIVWRQVSQPAASIVSQTLEFRSGRRETIEIAAAPVLPDAEGQPIQLFAVASRLPRLAPPCPGEPRDLVVRNFGRNLRFVDVGAGLPDLL